MQRTRGKTWGNDRREFILLFLPERVRGQKTDFHFEDRIIRLVRFSHSNRRKLARTARNRTSYSRCTVFTSRPTRRVVSYVICTIITHFLGANDGYATIVWQTKYQLYAIVASISRIRRRIRHIRVSGKRFAEHWVGSSLLERCGRRQNESRVGRQNERRGCNGGFRLNESPRSRYSARTAAGKRSTETQRKRALVRNTHGCSRIKNSKMRKKFVKRYALYGHVGKKRTITTVTRFFP